MEISRDQSEMSSIADMILQTATEVIHSRVPEGFEWIEQYGQYYSRDCGYFYEPNTGLFYHSETQMYYIFNDDTQEYEVYKCMQKTQWSSRAHKKKANKIFGSGMDKMDQDSIDVCELVFSLTDRLCFQEKKVKRKHIDKVRKRNNRVKTTEYFDEITGEIVVVPHPNNRKYEEGECSSSGSDTTSESCNDENVVWKNSKNRRRMRKKRIGTSADRDEVLLKNEESIGDNCNSDERIQMMHEEGFSQPPLLRIIDEKNNLYVITICGGIVGKENTCDIPVEDSSVPNKFLEFTFFPESISFVLKKLTGKMRATLNDFELLIDDSRELEHGDFVQFANKLLKIHVHYGNNTCTGCEPGLLQSGEPVNYSASNVPSGETARRRTLKMLKGMYGINDYQDNSQVRHRGLDRAAKRRFLVGSESEKVACAPGDSNDIYAGCAAKPLPGFIAHTGSYTVHSISAENKGFKMMKSMGWKEGEGLGRGGDGRREPVMSSIKNNRAGLGSASTDKKIPMTRRDAILDKTRERYELVSKDA